MAKVVHQSAPAFILTVAGQEFTQVSPEGVVSLQVEDHVDMANMATVILGTSESSPGHSFEIGDPVEVKMRTEDHFLFKGEIIAMEHSFQISGTSTMILRCIDNVHRLGRGRKTRFWNDVTDAHVAREVGQESGLLVLSDPTLKVRPYILQRNESNISFLKRLAARNNFQVRVDQDKLLFKQAELSGEPVEVKMGDNLVSMSVNFNSVNQVEKVVVQGWSIKDKKEVIGTCEASKLRKIGSGELGAEVSKVFGTNVAYITDVPVSDQGIADAIAGSEMARIARQFCRGKCAVLGDNFISAGKIVEFSGFSEGLNGKYYVISSRHSINPRSGYMTDFTFCSNTYGK